MRKKLDKIIDLNKVRNFILKSLVFKKDFVLKRMIDILVCIKKIISMI